MTRRQYDTQRELHVALYIGNRIGTNKERSCKPYILNKLIK